MFSSTFCSFCTGQPVCPSCILQSLRCFFTSHYSELCSFFSEPSYIRYPRFQTDRNKIHAATILTFLTISAVIFDPIMPLQCAGISLWPKPRIMSWPSPLAILLSPNFTIASPDHQYLSPAVSRYLHLILTEHHHPLVTRQ